MLGSEEADLRPGSAQPARPPGSSPRSKEWPVNFTLFTGVRIRLPCVNSDIFGDVKKKLWQLAGLKEETSNYIFRLSNAEAFFQDEDTFGSLLESFILYREEGFSDSLEVCVIDKKDIGDALKRHMHSPSVNGLTRLHGPLKKRSSAGVHQYQQRYFALQDNTLFYFGSQEDYEKKSPASDVIPMGSCMVEKGTQSGAKWSLYRSKPAPRSSSKTAPRPSGSSPGKPNEPVKKGPRKNTIPTTGNSLLDLLNKNGAEHSVDFTFRIDAEVVGKREFWFRAKDNEERKNWINVVRAVNIQRVKRIILDITRELSDRIDQPLLLQVTNDDTKEADRLMEVYAHGMYPKLTQTENSVLAEMFNSALLLLDTPFFAEDTYNEILFTHDSLPSMLRNVPLSMRALLEHIFTFLHQATSYSEVNGLTPAFIAEMMSPLVFAQETRPIHRKIITALLEKVPKLWSLLPEAYYQELQAKSTPHGRKLSAPATDLIPGSRKVDDELDVHRSLPHVAHQLTSVPEHNFKGAKPPSPPLNKQAAPISPLPKKGSFFWTSSPTPSPPPPPPQQRPSSNSSASQPPPPVKTSTGGSLPTINEPRPPEHARNISPTKAQLMRQQDENTREKRLGSDGTNRRKFSKDTKLPRLAYPLHFSVTDSSTKEVVIRVIEETQTNENQKFSPGRYYSLADLVQESLGNQTKTLTVEEILPLTHSYVVNYDYDEIANNTNPLSARLSLSANAPVTPTGSSTPTLLASPSPIAPLHISPSALPNSILAQYSGITSPRLRALSSRSPSSAATGGTSSIVAPVTPRCRSSSASPASYSVSSTKASLANMFLPEPICLAYLAQRNLFNTMYQLTSYLANRPPTPQMSKGSVDMAWEGLERIKKLAISGMDRRKSSGGSRRSINDKRHSLAARHRALSQHLLDDDDDDFVDIDTAMPPSLAHLHAHPPRRAPPHPPHRRLNSRNLRPVLSTTALSSLTASFADNTTPQATPRGSLSVTTATAAPFTTITTTAVDDTSSQTTITTDLGVDNSPVVGSLSPPMLGRPHSAAMIHTASPQQTNNYTTRILTTTSIPTLDLASNSNPSPKTSPKNAPTSNLPRESSFEGNEEIKEKLFKPISFDLNSSFEHVMRYGESRACFLKFLQSEYADENMLFADEVKVFCGAHELEQHEMAWRIYKYYMGPNAVKPINVRGMSSQVQEALMHSDRTETIAQCTFLFLEAQAAVLSLLKFGSFPRFMSSPFWETFVESFKQREWIRMKVVKLTKFHTTAMRVLQFDPASLTITFFKPDHTAEFTKVEVVIPPINLLNVQLSVENSKKLKISFFKGDQRLLRTQREWKIIFRTNAERERFARLVTSNLLLRRSLQESQAATVYKPQPLKLDKHIEDLVADLPVYEVASELHESWMATKLREGWVYGEVYSEAEHTHPDLNPFRLLDTKEQEYYMDVSSLTIGSMLELGYKITETESQPLNVNLEEDSRLLLLVEFLAENAHDCWAFNKVKLGWVHGLTRSEDNKTHPNLVPYVDLDEADKDWNRQAAHTVLKALLERGFKIEPEV